MLMSIRTSRLLSPVLAASLFTAVVLGAGCTKRKKDLPIGPDRYANTYVTMQAKSPTELADAEPQNCHLQDTPDGPAADGLCLTPTNLEMWTSELTLLGNNRLAAVSRLLGNGSGLSNTGYLDGAAFDLAMASTLKGQDNLYGVYSLKPDWETLRIDVVYLRVSFSVKGESWEMLIPYSSQPLEKEAWVESCFTPATRELIHIRANPVSGLKLQRGDYLFCKPAAGATCAFSEFQWFDKVTKTLSTKRPENPRTFDYLRANSSASCLSPESDSGAASVSIASVPLLVAINKPLPKFYADLSHGDASQTNQGAKTPVGVSRDDWQAHLDAKLPNDPHLIYFINKGESVESGNQLNLKLAFELTNYLYLDKVSSIDSTSIEDILAGITTKDIFFREVTPVGRDFLPFLRVDLIPSVSTAPLSEIYRRPEAGTKATPAPKS